MEQIINEEKMINIVCELNKKLIEAQEMISVLKTVIEEKDMVLEHILDNTNR